MHTTWSFKRHSVDVVIRRSQKKFIYVQKIPEYESNIKKS